MSMDTISKIKLSVVIPLYNEEESIDKLYDLLEHVLTKTNLIYEILFVDDGSSDNTFLKAKKIASKNKRLRVIKFRRNYGQTPAMVAGILNARGEVIITMDGDLQNDPSDIPKFIKKINEGYDLVIGWRHKRQDKLVTRKIPSKIANWIIGKITGVPIKDNGCSLKAYKAELIKNIPLYSEMHRFIPAMSSIAGARIIEIKVRHHPRKFGTSKYGLSRIYKVLLDLIAIKTIISFSPRPIFGFGIISVISAFVSIIFLGVSIFQVFLTPDQSSVIAMSISLLFGVLSIFLLLLGMLCDLVVKTGNMRFDQLSLLTAFKEIHTNSRKPRILAYEEET
jgi:glycosyltransferase involved in cell wall biosynthesis